MLNEFVNKKSMRTRSVINKKLLRKFIADTNSNLSYALKQLLMCT